MNITELYVHRVRKQVHQRSLHKNGVKTKKTLLDTYLHSELADHTRLKFKWYFLLIKLLVYSPRIYDGILQIQLLRAEQVHSKIRIRVETQEPLVQDLFHVVQYLLFKHAFREFLKNNKRIKF